MITIDQDFENGSVGQVTRLGDDWYHIGLRPDTWYWTHFRITGCKNHTIVFTLTYLPNQHSNRWGTVDSGDPERPNYTCRIPYVSYDKKEWAHVDDAQKMAEMPNSIRFSHRFNKDEAYVCYSIPYTYSDLTRWLDRIRDRSEIQIDTIGSTAGGRDVPMVTIGAPHRDKPVLFFISREDGDEVTSNVAIEGLIDRMIDGSPEMRRMLDRVFFRIVPMTAIDAVVAGSPYGAKVYMAREWFRDPPLPEIESIKSVVKECFANHRVLLMGKLHGGQTYDNPPVWDFRVFDHDLRKMLPGERPRDDQLDPVWNPFLRDAVPWVRQLTIFESYLQKEFDFWPFFSTHTNGRDPDNLREQGALFADLLGRYVEEKTK